MHLHSLPEEGDLVEGPEVEEVGLVVADFRVVSIKDDERSIEGI
jgi:hypothetical protein